MADVAAIREELRGDITAATGVMSNFDQILIAGKLQDIKVNGTDEDYSAVRNLVISSGRFLDAGNVTRREKVALLTDHLAQRMYGSTAAALGQIARLFGLQFTVIGTFHERVETFGQSEVDRDTVVIPITVLRYFTPVERIDPLYVQVRSAPEVERTAARVQEILAARHRPGAAYHVETLTAILNAARNISLILSLVLVLVSHRIDVSLMCYANRAAGARQKFYCFGQRSSYAVSEYRNGVCAADLHYIDWPAGYIARGVHKKLCVY